MFGTYLRRELRQRLRQTVAISLGLALGVGLVIIVTAVSAGLRDAQDGALRALYGVGSELTVSQAPSGGRFSATPSAPPRVERDSGAGPRRGQTFQQDTLFSRQLGPLRFSTVDSISRLPAVAAAAGGLALTDLQVFGTASPTAPAASPRRPRPTARPAPIDTRIFQVSGVDAARSEVGPLASLALRTGRTLAAADANANVAVVGSTYAKQRGLTVGQTITVGRTALRVVGIGSQPNGSPSADVYLPLRRAQSLAGMANQVNVIYVSAASSGDVDSLRQAISTLLPSATVTTISDIASTVTGSLAAASRLANDLGRWLAAAVLAAAVLLASLMTSAAVSRRVRDFGTLMALGWPSPRIVGQVLGEATVTGVVGAIIGVALGYGGAALVTALAPSLTASIAVSGAARGGAVATANPGKPVVVDLGAPIAPSVIILAVVLAVTGGLVAGAFGGWRAARLRPAAALARVA
jgi:ABC-type lipoprotein release transport system permease subunit